MALFPARRCRWSLPRFRLVHRDYDCLAIVCGTAVLLALYLGRDRDLPLTAQEGLPVATFGAGDGRLGHVVMATTCHRGDESDATPVLCWPASGLVPIVSPAVAGFAPAGQAHGLGAACAPGRPSAGPGRRRLPFIWSIRPVPGHRPVRLAISLWAQPEAKGGHRPGNQRQPVVHEPPAGHGEGRGGPRRAETDGDGHQTPAPPGRGCPAPSVALMHLAGVTLRPEPSRGHGLSLVVHSGCRMARCSSIAMSTRRTRASSSVSPGWSSRKAVTIAFSVDAPSPRSRANGLIHAVDRLTESFGRFCKPNDWPPRGAWARVGEHGRGALGAVGQRLGSSFCPGRENW
jgi:hypothetical protein